MYNRENIDLRYLGLHVHLGVLECSKPNTFSIRALYGGYSVSIGMMADTGSGRDCGFSRGSVLGGNWEGCCLWKVP